MPGLSTEATIAMAMVIVLMGVIITAYHVLLDLRQRRRTGQVASSPAAPSGQGPRTAGAEPAPRRPSAPAARSPLRELARRIDACQERLGQAVSWLMFGMVVVVFSDVIFRYVFNRSWVIVQEAEWHLFGFVYLLAAGYTMLHDEHVRIDIVYSAFSPQKKAWFDFFLLFVMFFPSCLLVLYTAWPFVAHSFQVNEGSPDPGGIPGRWVYKGVILAGFVLLMVQGVSQAIKNFYWAKGWEDREQRVQEIH